MEREALILDMTPNAIEALKRVIAEANETDVLGVRIAAQGGCEGLRYEMGLEAAAQEGDAVIHFGELMVFVDEQSKSLLAGTEVDFCETALATGFVFNNPNGCSSCSKRKSCGG